MWDSFGCIGSSNGDSEGQGDAGISSPRLPPLPFKGFRLEQGDWGDVLVKISQHTVISWKEVKLLYATLLILFLSPYLHHLLNSLNITKLQMRR